MNLFKPKASVNEAQINEITTIVLDCDNHIAVHKTVRENYEAFKTKNTAYDYPAQDAIHYEPAWYNIPTKLAFFFERHKTLAKFLDWFKLREKAVHEILFIHKKGEFKPIQAEFFAGTDWASVNFMLNNNTTCEGTYQEIKARFPRLGVSLGAMKWLLIAIIAAAFIIGAFVFINNTHPAQAVVENVTATLTPSPTYFRSP